ncbi:PsiF family protein [Bordetella sp. N]|uniref:PsiF family protein n=1 Tax=Bordetella sp. N TaxID=1746199 RepID=UPI00070E05EB|nr:PsiF family protein [Bordetella sp. N]ALM82640.1 hypothetical protein ASB57_06430 [Bordetella sp. N]
MNHRSSQLFAAVILAVSCSAPVWAQTAPTPATPSNGKALTPQQKRMSDCSTANKGKTGEAYKAGVASCLKGDKPAENGKTLTPQQQRMKDCNGQASGKSLTGDARKTFMSTCLKSKS